MGNHFRYYHDRLNPKFWIGWKFDPIIREKLLKIVEGFLRGPGLVIDVEDIQLTGSLANYNYNEYSDLDVHLLVDFAKMGKSKIVKAALDGKRFVWNLRHDIMIKGHEVELYFQDVHEPHVASGLFSLSNDKWLKKPHPSHPEIDPKDVAKKAEGLSELINKMSEMVSSVACSGPNARRCYQKASRLKTKIREMRKRGLHREGEFSVENLAFKRLRNSGAIKKLISVVSKSYSNIFTYS